MLAVIDQTGDTVANLHPCVVYGCQYVGFALVNMLTDLRKQMQCPAVA